MISSYYKLLLLGFLWSLQFFFIDLSSKLYDSYQLSFLRIFYATFFLINYCYFKNINKQVSRSYINWIKVIILSLFEIVFPINLFIWGQLLINNNSETAVLVGTIPFFTLIIVLITKMEKFTLNKFYSVIVGFIGIIILLGPNFTLSNNFNILARLSVLLGSIFLAIACVIIKKFPKENPYILSRDTFVIAFIIIFIYNYRFIMQEEYLFIINQDNIIAFISVILLGIISSGISYIIYIKLLQIEGASFCSLSNYLVIFFASVINIIFFKKNMEINVLIGLILIIISMIINSSKISSKISKIL